MVRTYLDAFCQVRKIKKVKVYSPNRENVARYAQEVSKRHSIEVEPATNAREAIRSADIVSICTSTNEPVFENDWLAGEATPRLANTKGPGVYGRAGCLGSEARSD